MPVSHENSCNSGVMGLIIQAVARGADRGQLVAARRRQKRVSVM